MNNKIFFTTPTLFVIFMLMALTQTNILFATEDVIIEERIIAIVDDMPILLSEVELSIMMETQTEMPTDPDEYDLLIRYRLEAMIDEKLLFHAAELESIVVSEEYLNQVFNEQWEQIKGQFATEDLLRQALEQEGFKLQEFKVMRREMLKETLTKQTLIREKFGEINVSQEYVDSFYHEFKDSLPLRPPTARLSVIVLRKGIDTETQSKLAVLAQNTYENLISTADFETIATDLSNDNPSMMIFGGELGTFNYGDLHPALETAAFGLKDDEISTPVESPRGIHILRRIEGTNSKITLEHITFTQAQDTDNSQFEDYVNSIYERIIASPDSFESFVEMFSKDDETGSRDGDIGYFQIEQLDQEMKSRIAGNQKGDILKPIIDGEEADIFKLTDLLLESQMNLEDDYDIMVEMAKQHKMMLSIKKYVDKVRENIFVEIRL